MNFIKKQFNIIHQPWFKYLLVGGTNFLVCLLLMSLGAVMGLNYLVYTALGYGAGMTNSYVLNGCVTFGDSKNHSWLTRLEKLLDVQKIVYFFTINLSLLGMVESIEYLLVHHFFWVEYEAIAVGMLVYVGLGYQLNRRWVFSNPWLQSSL